MNPQANKIGRTISGILSRQWTAFVCVLLALSGSLEMQAQNSATLAEMSSTDIIALLDGSKMITGLTAGQGKGDTTVAVSAEDLVTKVYGVLDSTHSRRQHLADSYNQISKVPVCDHSAYWLETAGGFNVNYAGMTPEVAALARYEGDELADYGYFFMFPYSDAEKSEVNAIQSLFSGTLLSDLSNISDDWGVNTLSGDLFEVIGEYDSNYVAVRLIDDPSGNGGEGRYILMLSVEPNAFGVADDMAAL